MNKKLTLAVLAAVVFAFRANAQTPTHDASINLAPMAFGNYSGAYHLNFNENMSLGSVVGYQNLEIKTTDMSGNSSTVGYKGFYVAPEFRYYFNPGNGNEGFFAGAYMKFRSMGTTGNAYADLDKDGSIKNYDEKNTGLSAGVIAGRLWATPSGITFSTWFGLGYYLFDNTTYTNNFDPDPAFSLDTNLPTLDFRLGLSVGYRFGM
jgi:hypothetical protein